MLKNKILDLLNRSNFMTLSTSVAGNSSAANVYFANDGLDIYFFTFNPSRKAVQISMNPKVQCVIRPDGEDGIKELQIDAYASKVTDEDEVEKAKKAILNVTEAFSEYMHDDFLIANDVIGYYKIQPTTIKYVDFFAGFIINILGFKATSWLLNLFQTVWVVVFVILFQPEIRRLLTSVGQNRILRKLFQIEKTAIQEDILFSIEEIKRTSGVLYLFLNVKIP